MHECRERKDAQERPLFALCRAGCPNAAGAGMRKSGRVEKGHGWTFSTIY